MLVLDTAPVSAATQPAQVPSASGRPSRATESSLELLIGAAGKRSDDGTVVIDLRLLNAGSEPAPAFLPDRLQAEIQAGEEIRKVWLQKASLSQARMIVPAGGFAEASYHLPDPHGAIAEGATIAIPSWSRQQVVITALPATLAKAIVPRKAIDTTLPADTATDATFPPADRHSGNAFLDNLSAYEPIYAVYGPGTNTAARIQVSFKYRLFGSRQRQGLSPSWREGMHFAFTQRMFWDLNAESSPFRNIDYLPELFYLTPSATLTSGVSLAGQAGLRHESNGRDGPASRSLNTLYVAPMAAFPLDGGYRLIVGPRLSMLIGDKEDNPDILKYRGTTSLFVEIGKDDGLRLSTASRFNFSSGKGAFSADISYPLNRLLGGGPDLYLFAQSFIGYGENLLDYDRRTNRFRLGLAIVR
ncbi:MAG: phospholipase A [Novosphingobium sp.]